MDVPSAPIEIDSDHEGDQLAHEGFEEIAPPTAVRIPCHGVRGGAPPRLPRTSAVRGQALTKGILREGGALDPSISSQDWLDNEISRHRPASPSTSKTHLSFSIPVPTTGGLEDLSTLYDQASLDAAEADALARTKTFRWQMTAVQMNLSRAKQEYRDLHHDYQELQRKVPATHGTVPKHVDTSFAITLAEDALEEIESIHRKLSLRNSELEWDLVTCRTELGATKNTLTAIQANIQQ